MSLAIEQALKRGGVESCLEPQRNVTYQSKVTIEHCEDMCNGLAVGQ